MSFTLLTTAGRFLPPLMLEARISSSCGSLYFAAADATPSNLRTLRLHVRDAFKSSGEGVHLELRINDPEAAPRLRTWLDRLAAAGVRVTRAT